MGGSVADFPNSPEGLTRIYNVHNKRATVKLYRKTDSSQIKSFEKATIEPAGHYDFTGNTDDCFYAHVYVCRMCNTNWAESMGVLLNANMAYVWDGEEIVSPQEHVKRLSARVPTVCTSQSPACPPEMALALLGDSNDRRGGLTRIYNGHSKLATVKLYRKTDSLQLKAFEMGAIEPAGHYDFKGNAEDCFFAHVYDRRMCKTNWAENEGFLINANMTYVWDGDANEIISAEEHVKRFSESRNAMHDKLVGA